MALTITHTFESSLSDDPIAVAAGKVPPSQWNSPHKVTGSLPASQVSNIPFGSVTATDVQSAINQLDSLIPAPGPGTDPLFLTKGFDLTTTAPQIGLNVDHSFASAANISTFIPDASELVPGFCNMQVFNIDAQMYNADYDFGFVLRKTSFYPLKISMQGYASAQRFGIARDIHGYGMGDCFFATDHMDYWGGCYSGDEGVGWLSASLIEQPWTFARSNIVSVARSGINTTTTQIINNSKDIQTVTVVSSAGASIGDWVIIDQSVDVGQNSIEAVQLTGVGAGTISGKFRIDHANGVTVTPALVLHMSSLGFFGQQRVCVNKTTAVTYSVGQIDGKSGAGLNNAAANWTVGMVGGNALNIGAISLTKDNYTGAPYSALDPLTNWYQITSISSPTFLNIHSTTVAGDASYRGPGTFPSNYIIRPAARVLYLDTANTKAICETSTHVWTAGDSVECVCSPYPDCTGMDYRFAFYTGGSTLRSMLSLGNAGARQFDNCILVNGTHDPLKTNNRDEWAFGQGIQIQGTQTGITLLGTMTTGIRFAGAAGDVTRGIRWDGGGWISDNSYGGFDFVSSGTFRLAYNGAFGSQPGLAIATVGAPQASYPRAALDVDLGNAAHSGLIISYGFAGATNLIQLKDPFGVIGNVDIDANLMMKSIRGTAVLFANRPATPVEGMIVAFTDSTVNTFGTIIFGGGAFHVLGYYNGTNWTVIGA